MPIGVIWYPPVDQQAYDAIREKVFDASLDKGLRFHAAGEAEGSWRIIETWDSREGLGRFHPGRPRPRSRRGKRRASPYSRARARLRHPFPEPVVTRRSSPPSRGPGGSRRCRRENVAGPNGDGPSAPVRLAWNSLAASCRGSLVYRFVA
jgi:hypothetical protein